MNNIQLYTKISSLSLELKKEVDDFVDFLKSNADKRKPSNQKRIAGLAKGELTIHENFDDPIEGFEQYLK